MEEQHENCKLLVIPDPVIGEFGCKAVWGLGNQIFLYAGSRPLPDGPSGLLTDNALIHHVKWDTEMHRPIPRKLVSESRGTFMNLQKQKPQDDSAITKRTHMLKFSREYRSIIKAASKELHQSLVQGISLHDGDSECRREDIVAQLEMFEMIELLWSLCEILFIDFVSEGLVLKQLLDWLRLRFCDGDHKAQEVVKSQLAEGHSDYWEAIYSLLLQGRIEETRHLLSLHSNFKSELFTFVDILLRKMPLFTSMTGLSVAEFEMKWHQWQDECTRLMEDGTFASDNNLSVICRILAGDDRIFLALKDMLGTWYCMLISRLFYQKPYIKAIELFFHSQFCIEAFGGMSSLTPWDQIILAAVELNIHRVIRDCSSSFSSWWFVSHLTDLLYHRGTLEPRTLNFGSDSREFLLLEYATSLMSHHSLWQVGIQYLEHCPVYGKHYIAQFLEHIPLETERKAQKVLKLCEKYNLTEQAKSICKVMAMKALHNKRLGSALSWSLKSKNSSFSAFIADKFLSEYTNAGTFSSLDLIDNLGSSMVLSTKLTFLGKYREFHRLYGSKDFKKAAELLLSLLSARIAPKRFWPSLLHDAIPLLEAKMVIFSSEQTYELLHCLEELDMSKTLDQTLSRQLGTNDLGENLDVIRLALARNLARAIVEEGTLNSSL